MKNKKKYKIKNRLYCKKNKKKFKRVSGFLVVGGVGPPPIGFCINIQYASILLFTLKYTPKKLELSKILLSRACAYAGNV